MIGCLLLKRIYDYGDEPLAKSLSDESLDAAKPSMYQKTELPQKGEEK